MTQTDLSYVRLCGLVGIPDTRMYEGHLIRHAELCSAFLHHIELKSIYFTRAFFFINISFHKNNPVYTIPVCFFLFSQRNKRTRSIRSVMQVGFPH